MSGAEFDDDVTVDVDAALLAQLRTQAARRAARSDNEEVSGRVDKAPDGADGATRDIDAEVIEAAHAGDYDGDVPTVEGYGALREIGRGGFSRVYEALQFEFQRWVAIKVLNQTLESSGEIGQFERECRSMGVLSRHPNIVTVFASAFTSDNRPCIVMELFPHGSYMNLLQRTGPLSLEDLLPLGVRISGALATAHRQGMVHGDVKPQNIFQSEFGMAALGDFGIATLMHRRMEGSKTRLSLYYAAPELIESGISATSPFADQYSLGATIYTLATGLRPFQADAGDTTERLLSRMLIEPPPRLGRAFPASLDDALAQAMAREPQDRHRDAVAFAAAMANVQQELGFKPTEIPITRDAGRYVGQTPGSDPRSTTGPRSPDSPARTGDTSPAAASTDEDLAVVSQTVVRPLMPVSTASLVPEPEPPQEKPRIPMWAKIGSVVAAVLVAVAIYAFTVGSKNGGNGEDEVASTALPVTSTPEAPETTALPVTSTPEAPETTAPPADPPEVPVPRFADVPPDHPHFEAIETVAADGITTGCGDGINFCPDSAVTRAQMARFLQRALDLPAPDEPASFADVDPDGVHAEAIEAVLAKGITTGCGDGTNFCPDDEVTRAQMARFLERAFKIPVPEEPAGFTDVDPDGAHAEAIEAVFAAEIIQGCNTDPLRYCPDDKVTRAEMASVLIQALSLDS